MTRRDLALAALLTTVAALPGAAESEEPRLIRQEPGGQLPIEAANRLVLDNIRGTLLLRAGRPGELRYETRTLDNERRPRPLALWRRSASELALALPAGSEAERVLLEVAVGPPLAVLVVTTDSHLEISGIPTPVTVRGTHLDCEVDGVAAALRLDVAESKVRIENAGSDVDFVGQDVETTVRGVAGALNLRLVRGRLEVSDVRGAVDLDLEEVPALVSELSQPIHLAARDAAVELRRVTAGGELELDAAPLRLVEVGGSLRVHTDSDVEFERLSASLLVESFGGSVRGSGNSGPTSVSTYSAQVTLENLQDGARVSGDALTVEVRSVKGAVGVEGTSSQIRVANIAGPATVSNDGGDIEVQAVEQQVTISSRRGNVFVEGAKGLVELRADGDEVSVQWAEIPAQGNQLVENASGIVLARFPPKAACRVEAQSTHGQVDSELPGIEASTARAAAGSLGGAMQPVIQIRSGGDIYIALAEPGGE